MNRMNESRPLNWYRASHRAVENEGMSTFQARFNGDCRIMSVIRPNRKTLKAGPPAELANGWLGQGICAPAAGARAPNRAVEPAR